MNTAKTVSIIVLFISFVTAWYFYPFLPAEMASHWNTQGQVDGYMGKLWGLLLMPILMVFFTVLFFVIPNIDPEKKNIEKFWSEFDKFIIVFNLFMLYVYILTILWNLGYGLNMTAAIMPAFAVLFWFCGSLIGKAKRNYTIGIRFPWTLASDVVWDKTHKIGEKLFKLIALLAFLATFFVNYAFWLLFVPIIASVIFLFIYSYLEYRKVK
ncbi:MAG: DUF1648 domain-containing protein [Candidatus Paceibacterota bacterium]